MNPFYAEYIATAKGLATERGLEWDLVCDDQGKVNKDTRWNLTALVGLMPPPTMWLGQIGIERASFEKLNQMRCGRNEPPLFSSLMSQAWRDIYQAIIIHQLLIGKTKPMSAIKAAMPVRQLAPLAGATPPWSVTPDQVQQVYNAVLQGSESGKVALDFATMIRNIFDRQKLCDIPSLARFVRVRRRPPCAG